MLHSTVNNIGQLPCASVSVLRYTASVLASVSEATALVLASVSNPAASVLVSASSALVTTLMKRQFTRHYRNVCVCVAYDHALCQYIMYKNCDRNDEQKGVGHSVRRRP